MIEPKEGSIYHLINERYKEDYIIRVIRVNNYERDYYRFDFIILNTIKGCTYTDKELPSVVNDKLIELTEEEKDKIMVELL